MDGAVAYTRLRVVVEDIGEVIRTPRLRVVVDVAVGEDLVILRGETVILNARVNLRGGPLEGIRHRIGVGGLVEEGDGLLHIHGLEAHRDVEVHGMIDYCIL